MSDLADFPLSAEAEVEWQRLHQAITFSNRFWLGFVFSPSATAAFALKLRAQHLVESRQKTFFPIIVSAPEVLASIHWKLAALPPDPNRGCVWVVAMRTDPPFAERKLWTSAWDEAFLRLNERRDALRLTHQSGLVFAGPTEMKERIREAAPDLWSVRNVVVELVAQGKQTDVSLVDAPGSVLKRSLIDRKSSATIDIRKLFREFTNSDLEFALAIANQTDPSHPYARALALLEAVDGYLREGRREDAKQTAEEALALLRSADDMLAETRALAVLAETEYNCKVYASARDHIEEALQKRSQYAKDEIPVYWHVLSGDIELAEGKYEQAQHRYRQGLLALDQERAPKSLETVRGRLYLHVQLGNACFAAGDLKAAAEELLPCVEMAKTLSEHNIPGMLAVHSSVLKWLGDAWDEMGAQVHAEAAYSEAVSLDRRILEEHSESTEAQMQLSISLNRLAGVRRAAGDLEAAREAFQEALALRRNINQILGATAESLTALRSSLRKVIQIQTELGATENNHTLEQEKHAVQEALRALRNDAIKQGRRDSIPDSLP